MPLPATNPTVGDSYGRYPIDALHREIRKIPALGLGPDSIKPPDQCRSQDDCGEEDVGAFVIAFRIADLLSWQAYWPVADASGLVRIGECPNLPNAHFLHLQAEPNTAPSVVS